MAAPSVQSTDDTRLSLLCSRQVKAAAPRRGIDAKPERGRIHWDPLQNELCGGPI
jgi:hypothetical protein